MSAAVKETETKVCKNPDCPAGREPQPVSNFYVSKNENGTRWYQPRCKKCHNIKSRENAKRRKAERKTQQAPPESIKAVVPAPEPSRPCQHVWMCGDDYIRRTLPSFFDTHGPAARGYEWQVCRECGAAKEVLVYDASEYADKDDPLPAREEFRPALTVAVGREPSEAVAAASQAVAALAPTVVKNIRLLPPEHEPILTKEDVDEQLAEWAEQEFFGDGMKDWPPQEQQPEPEREPAKEPSATETDLLAEARRRIDELERERDAWREKAAALARDNLTLRARLDLAEAEADLAALDRQRASLQQEISRLRAILKGHGERVIEEALA